MHRGSPEAVCYHVRITQDFVALPDFSSKNDLTGNTYVLSTRVNGLLLPGTEASPLRCLQQASASRCSGATASLQAPSPAAAPTAPTGSASTASCTTVRCRRQLAEPKQLAGTTWTTKRGGASNDPSASAGRSSHPPTRGATRLDRRGQRRAARRDLIGVYSTIQSSLLLLPPLRAAQMRLIILELSRTPPSSRISYAA